MKLLYTLDRDNFPSRNFKAGKDLNSNPEYPYWPEKGMWLSPAIETETGVTSPWIESQIQKFGKASEEPKRVYTLQDDTSLYHFRTLSDYTFAYGKFPLFMKEHKYIYDQYLDKSVHFSKQIAKWMDFYDTFNTWKTELCAKTGISDIGLESEAITEPIFFTDCDDNIVKLEFTFDANNLPDFGYMCFDDITGYVRRKNGYSNKGAIILLKHICNYIIRYIKKMSQVIKPSPDDSIIGIDYNAMRSAGYKGIYIHKTAIEETRKVPEGSALYEIVDPLLYWQPETICVWSYCFTE